MGSRGQGRRLATPSAAVTVVPPLSVAATRFGTAPPVPLRPAASTLSIRRSCRRGWGGAVAAVAARVGPLRRRTPTL